MDDYIKVPTSPEVWAVIRARHTELVVFGSYSAPQGDRYGNTNTGEMRTSYGFHDCYMPIIEARTTWRINREKPHERIDEKHEYWLCIPCCEE
jgi:hypothetical protein